MSKATEFISITGICSGFCKNSIHTAGNFCLASHKSNSVTRVKINVLSKYMFEFLQVSEIMLQSFNTLALYGLILIPHSFHSIVINFNGVKLACIT